MRGGLFLLMAAAIPLQARPEEVSPTQVPPSGERKADFLFGPPKVSIGVRGGYLFAATGSDIYDFLESNLTVEKSDFDTPVFGVDFALALNRRVDFVTGFELSKAGIDSEYRDFVDPNDLPITQRTELKVMPFSGSLKLYLTSRGREVSRYAFVPASVRPYLGAGGGFLWYELEQSGDFVDFMDSSIFSSSFRSSGFGLEGHAFGGVDVALSPRWFLSIEARYLWAHADLGEDFVSFAPIDLSGLRTTAAINVSF